MGKLAARLGDMTSHGGVITVGCPTVIIGGKPAARVGDMHVCPMCNPGPSPHVGGPVSLGSPMVLIGGMPAARIGDMAVCAGPPDSIAMGCPTVLIGEGGGGSAKGGGAGSAAAAAASASAATALTDNLEAWTKIEHWVEFEFVDKAGKPVSGVPYKFTGSDNKVSGGVLRPDGKVKRDALPSGQCKVQLFHVSDAKWSKTKANVGEKVKMNAEVEGYESGTPAVFEIYEHDLKGADARVATVEAKVQGTKVEAEWEYVPPVAPDSIADAAAKPDRYSAPLHFFEVLIGGSKCRSGMFECASFVEIELRNDNGQPVPNEKYVVYLSNGEIRRGKLSGSGFARIDNCPTVDHRIEFQELKATRKPKQGK